MQSREGPRRRSNLTFDAAKVFPVARHDLDFDLDGEVGRFRARKGQGGNRRPVGLQPRGDFARYFF